MRVHDIGRDDANSDGARDMDAEHEKGDEVEEGRPDHRIAWAQHAGRDQSRDRIRRVMHAIEEIKGQGDRNQGDQHWQVEDACHDGYVNLELIDDD